MEILADSEITKHLPKSKQLELSLLDTIKNIKAQPHDKFFSEREIIEKYKINQTTVRQTLSRMVDDGLIYRINGKGTFFSPQVKNSTVIVVSDYNSNSLQHGRWAILSFFTGLNSGISEQELPFLTETITPAEYLECIDDIDLIYKNLFGIIFFS